MIKGDGKGKRICGHKMIKETGHQTSLIKNKMNRIIKLCFTARGAIIVASLISCNQLYQAGNLIALRYPIETSLKSEIVERYLDTLIQKGGYDVPQKWMHYDKLINLDSINNKRIYFKSNPEEMYLLSFSGMPVLSDVYNPQIKQDDWVSERNLVSMEQEQRIKERLKKEILDPIEAMAKRDRLPDSIVYKQ